MFTDQSTDASLGGSCCTIDSIRGETYSNYWIAGISTVPGGISGSTSSSCLQILQFHNDSNELVINATYEIDDDGTPISKVASCPYDKELVLVSNELRSSVSLYKLPSTTFSASSSLSQRIDDHDDDFGAQQRNSQHRDTSYVDDYETTTSRIKEIATLTPEGGYGANIVDVAWRTDSSAGASSPSDHLLDNDEAAPTTLDSTNIVSSNNDAITLDLNGHLTVWDMNLQQQTQSFDTITTHLHNSSIPVSKVIWDPHSNGNTIAVTVPSKKQKYINVIKLYDLRCDNSSTGSGNLTIIENDIIGSGVYQQHYGIVDMDYNPNRPYMIGTACRDGTMKFYDIRRNTSNSNNINGNSSKYPLVTARGGHSHYCTGIKYNPYHDQLILSTGTDRVCNLWRISSCSSSPLLLTTDSNNPHDIMNPTSPTYSDINTDYGNEAISSSASSNINPASTAANAATNICVQQHNSDAFNSTDTFYTSCWGANDAWIYIVVSSSPNTNGKAILHHVPSQEKYKILL